MDDFDIYADLSTFTPEEEESESAAELRKKYETLEKELGDLRSKLEKIEGLNGTLKNNFSSLLKTAKAEIARKDRAITDLRSQLDSTLFRRQRQRNNNYQPPQAPVNGGYIDPQNQLQLLFQCKFSIPPPLIEPAYSQAKEPCNHYNGNQYDNQHINSAVSHETPFEVEPAAEELVKTEFFCPKEASDNDSDDGVTNKTEYRSTVYGERLRKKLMEEKENERKKKEEERIIATEKEIDKTKVEEGKLLREKEMEKERLDRESKIQKERDVEKKKKEDEKFMKEKEREKEKLDRESKFQREREFEKRRKEEKIMKEKEREKKKLHRESKIQKEREIDKRKKVEEKLLKEQEREKIRKEEEFKILREKEVDRKRKVEERLLKDQEKEKLRKEEEFKILREKEVDRKRKVEERLLKDQEKEKLRKEEELKILREKEVDRKRKVEERLLKDQEKEKLRKEEELKILREKEEELKRLKEKENRRRKTEEDKCLEKMEKEKIEEELMLNHKAEIEAELQQLSEKEKIDELMMLNAKEKIKDELMMLNTKADIEAKLYKLSRTEKINVELMMLNEKADIEAKLFKLSEKERIKKESKMLDERPRDEEKLHKKGRSKEEFNIYNEKEIENKSECLDKVNNKENLSLVNETTHAIESVFLYKQSETIKSTTESVVVEKLDLPSKEDKNKYTNCNGIHKENNNHTNHYNGKNNYNRSMMHKDHKDHNHHYYHDKQKHNGVHYTRIDPRYSRRDQHDNHEKNDRHRSSHRHKSRDNEKSSNKHRHKEDVKSRDHKKSKEKYTRTPKKIKSYKNEEDGKIILENHNIDKKHKEKVKTPKRKRKSHSEEKSPHQCKRIKTNIGDSNVVHTLGRNETLETDIFESEPKQSIEKEKRIENREDSAINNIENINQIINGDKNVEEKKTTPDDKIESLLEELEEGEIIDEEMESNKKTEINLDIIEKELKIKEDSKLNDNLINHKIYNTNPCKTFDKDNKLEKMSINEDEESTSTLELKNEESNRIEKETLISILSQDESDPHNDMRLISEKIEDVVPENSISVGKSLENEDNDTILTMTNVNIQKQANSQLDTNEMSGETTCKDIETETISIMKNVETVQNTVNENDHSEKLETKKSDEKDNCTATSDSLLKSLLQKKVNIQPNDASLKDTTPFTPVVKTEISVKNKVVNTGAIRTPIDITKLKTARNIIIVKRRRRPVQLSDSPPVVVSFHDNANNSRTIIS